MVVSPDQTKAFVDLIYQSAGNQKDLYRVQLKKTLKDNAQNLQKMIEGKLLPPQNVVTALVLNQLDESKNGLISQSELQEALVKISLENNLNVDNEALVEMVEAVYMNDDGSI